MGGRASEELFIGAISTGAANDFKQATEVAKMMVREYGMSALGPLCLNDQTHPFLRSAGGMPDTRNYSERTAQLIDEEIRKLVNEAMERARAVLQANREKVEIIAARLLAVEVIEEDDIRKLLGPKMVAAVPLLSHQHGDDQKAVPEPADLHA
jgi:cell division protease FtsH